MDLRAFGIGKRTWIQELHYQKRDHWLIALSILMLLLTVSLSLFAVGKFWIPPGLIT